MKKLWEGRFTKNTNALLEKFNASITFDKRMYAEDIKGSIAHSKMLSKQEIISQEDQLKIEKGLNQIKLEIENGEFIFKIEDEDIHMSIEKRLTEIIGSTAGKLHTARSRNDQVALDVRMYVRHQSLEIKELLINMENVLYTLSKKYKNTIIPGYTHLQRAQPILLAHHLLAYFQMFKRDISRIDDFLERSDEMPLGAGALAGTTFDLDRHYVAGQLGFSAPTVNSLDSVSDRDFIIELASIISIISMHLSRFSEEIIIWCTSEFSFIKLDDAFATGSSIMPQKKNPDIAELVRGKSGRIYGNLIAILTTMKALPLAYNKDMQEDKEGIFDSIDNIKICIEIFYEMLSTMDVNEKEILESMKKGFLNATDVADYLAKNGMPFREAHKVVGQIVSYCEQKNIAIDDMKFEEYLGFSNIFKEDVLEAITIENCVNNRNSYGGTSIKNVLMQLELAEKFLSDF
ncbi:MAG: argininosuccinate lyase [Leptotrichiaceae bacterium]|jgi:argininosuccinate lyase|nr:argininosuccinate lyase [Leptotrichiaceae bacterium]MBP6167785.1 argininosuccinate lyase [Leptotrichiaceae bacterium]MBP7026269.1 argininosuccinate lyase [Leptotrichiaceae bacterium]MBP8637363.1 argininosuccinate lyase [Leptotrichiaceae bacterium]MBP9875941.1 argininosuccinate lyase [Leptotrichiaceae bacterium]